MSRLNIDIQNSIVTISLNRPEKHNALDYSMFVELEECIKSLRNDRHIRAIIISGNGEDFCSGIDVKSIFSNASQARKLLWKWRPGKMNRAQMIGAGWRTIPVPVIAAIHGRCWGGGLQIALGADFRVASTKSSLSIMESKWGLIPDMGGTIALREIMSVDQAMKFAMTAQEIRAYEAIELGLVTEINESPLIRAKELAEQLTRQSPDTNAAIKKLYHKAWHHNDASIFSKETWYQIKVLLGSNQSIAVKRQNNEPQLPYNDRNNW